METRQESRFNAVLLMAGTLVAICGLALALGVGTGRAAPLAGSGAAPAVGSHTPWPHPTGSPPPHQTSTPGPHPSETPCPPPVLALRPRLQFGHAPAGGAAVYHQVLLNRVLTDTTVDLSGQSWGGWGIAVDPAQVVAQPGVSNTIAVTVSVPLSPTHWADVERVRAVAAASPPVTSTAYLITLTRRHPFADLSPSDWADDPVQYLVGQNVLAGYSDNTFRPNVYITRAQFAKMLVAATGWPLLTPAQPTFHDVPATYWGYSYVETAAAHGVISGYPDGTFHPYDFVTRAQLSKMVVLALGWGWHCRPPVAFRDVGPGDWFYDYAAMTSTAEVMTGYADNTFRPYALATRAQVAKILTLGLFSTPTD